MTHCMKNYLFYKFLPSTKKKNKKKEFTL